MRTAASRFRAWARRALCFLFLSSFFQQSVETFALCPQPNFVMSRLSYQSSRSLRRHLSASSSAAAAQQGDEKSDASLSRIPQQLVQSLDLEPVVRALSSHAGTRRGREAILGLVGEEREAERPAVVLQSDFDNVYVSSKRRRVTRETQVNSKKESQRLSQTRQSLAPIATSAKQARKEYELVQEATLALEGREGLTVPPLYGATSSPMNTDVIADTDHDEWLTLSSLEDWTLEYVLQADQVVQNLLRVHEWGNLSESQTWLPGLSGIAQTISVKDLRSVHQEIDGAVEIVTKRSPISSQAMAYRFQLSQDRFPVLILLREKEQKLQDIIEKEIKSEKGSPEATEYQGRMVLCVPKSQATADLGRIRGTTDNGRRCYVEPRSVVTTGDELAAVRNELVTVEEEIERDLMNTIQQASIAIDRGIHAMARLDIIFAKAAFGSELNGDIPIVQHDGRISVKSFVYPVLSLRKGVSVEDPVPIDLFLSHDQGSQALIISGPNGGGKTIALKSFGVACLLTKLAIPVPRSSKVTTDKPPRVDFFDKVLVEVGDQQSVLEGESTMMAKLNAFSSMIESVTPAQDYTANEQVSDAPDLSSLVLMDELGGGTDPAAGGAIAQAIVERLLESDKCRIVATTHSPRLKALSFNSTRYNCATVLLRSDPSSAFKCPSYQLEYGKIGDSYALGAASRCSPSLPEDVLTRAASLMASGKSDQEAEDGDYLRALTASLEQEKEAAQSAKNEWERNTRELQACRNAMMKLAESYADHLNGVENRLQGLFRELRDDETRDAFEVIGGILETLKLTKKKVKSEAEMLKERGLRKVSPDHTFLEGESVVVIAPGEYEGTTATVLLTDLPDSNDIAVAPSAPMWGDPFFSMDEKSADVTSPPSPLVVKRSEVAVWDMSGVWDDFDEDESQPVSVRESRQRLTGLLSTLKTSSKEGKAAEPRSKGSTFQSARQRKAARTKGKRK